MVVPQINKTLVAVATLMLAGGCSTTSERVTANTAAPEQAVIAPMTEPAKPERVETNIPSDSLLPLLEAEFALRAGQFPLALALMAEQTQILNDPDLARRTLRLSQFLRDDQQSLAAAMRLSELDPGDGSAAATAMSLLARKGEAVRAITYARTALERGARVNAPLLVADYEALPGHSRATVAEGIEELAAQWPDNADVEIARALVYRASFEPERAVAVLDTLLLRYPDEERALLLWTQMQLDNEAAQPFQRMADAVARNPGNEQMRLQYARLLAANGEFENASEQFRTLIEQSPRNDEYLMAGALIDLELDRYELAAISFQELINLGQRVDEAYYYLGRTFEESEQADAAIEAYSSVGSTREFVDAKRRAAALVVALEDETALTGFFGDQRSQFPDEAERLYLIEAELLRSAAAEQALTVYGEGLSRFPASISLLYGRAMLREAVGDYAGMEADLRAILADNPDNATTLNALGYTLTNHTTRYNEAAELIERALVLSPQEPAMLDSLGWVYFKMGRLAEAESILREAYALLPDPEVAAHLGETLWAQGKQVEARDIWRAVLAADAGNTHVRATIDRLGVVLD